MSLVTTLRGALLAAVAMTAVVGVTAHAQTPPLTPDIDGKYVAPKEGYDYDKRVVMVPMRDGTKLYTVIVVPEGRAERPDPADPHALQRRQAAPRATTQPSMLATLAEGDERVRARTATSASSRTSAASTARKATT